MTVTEGKITVSFDNDEIEAIYDIAIMCEELNNLMERTVEDTVADITRGELYDIAHNLYNLGSMLRRSSVLTFEREAE